MFIYKKSELIICVTNSFKNDLIKKGIIKIKLKLFPMALNYQKLKPTESINEVLEKYNLIMINLLFHLLVLLGWLMALKLF